MPVNKPPVCKLFMQAGGCKGFINRAPQKFCGVILPARPLPCFLLLPTRGCFHSGKLLSDTIAGLCCGCLPSPMSDRCNTRFWVNPRPGPGFGVPDHRG